MPRPAGVIVPGGVTVRVGARTRAGADWARASRGSREPRLRGQMAAAPAARPAAAASSWDRGHVAGRGGGARLALPHSALAPSGEPVWLELGRRSRWRCSLDASASRSRHPDPARAQRTRCCARGVRRSTKPACCISRPSRMRWLRRHSGGLIRVNRATPRLVDALPNGPRGHPTVQSSWPAACRR